MGLVLSLSRRKSNNRNHDREREREREEIDLAQAIREIDTTHICTDACAEIEAADIVISRIMPMPKNTPKR